MRFRASRLAGRTQKKRLLNKLSECSGKQSSRHHTNHKGREHDWVEPRVA
jgi:hypothetical protein